MEKLREMNRNLFAKNLLSTINEIKIKNSLSVNEKNMRFKIVAIKEVDKPLNARDDQMRLIALSEKNVGFRLLKFDEAVTLLSCQSPFVPIWINVSFLNIENEHYIFKLDTSVRFRKPSLLRNAETGHAPFKAII